MTGLPEARRQAAVRGLPGRDFSALLGNPTADMHANRPAVLFNYVGIQTIDGDYLLAANKDVFGGKPLPSLAKMHPDLSKRGFLSFVFDGRYKFARYYAPAAFNTPQTLDQIFKYNDVQLFDLSEDPDEMHNLALERDKYKDTILRMNALLNDEGLRKDFSADLEFSSRLARQVFLGRFLLGAVPARMIQFTRRSPRFSTLMQDLFAGTQSYLGLKNRLMQNLNGSLLEVAMSFGFSKRLSGGSRT